jgi:transcription antitermination factor NusG
MTTNGHNHSSESGTLATVLHASDAEAKWFALSVTVRHEKMVSQVLQHKGFETFLPLYTRRHQYNRRVREFEIPLFPGYLFCRSALNARLPILTTPGVLQMIGAGRVPIPVEDNEITSLQKAAEAGVSMAPHPFWQSGQTGRIATGPLAGIEGIVVNAKQPLRLILSVGLLRRSVLLEIDSDCVDLVSEA